MGSGSDTKVSLDRKALIKALLSMGAGGGFLYHSLVTGQGFLLLAPVWVFLVGICLLLYGLLQLVLMGAVRSRLKISEDELIRYGQGLEESTPMIVDLLSKGRPPSQVAMLVKESRGIPETVTLKYIIALGKFTRRNIDTCAGASTEEDGEVSER